MGVGKVISERNLAEEQWNNGREWQLGIGQGRSTETIYIYTEESTFFPNLSLTVFE